jgi:hypothetical protein
MLCLCKSRARRGLAARMLLVHLDSGPLLAPGERQQEPLSLAYTKAGAPLSALSRCELRNGWRPAPELSGTLDRSRGIGQCGPAFATSPYVGLVVAATGWRTTPPVSLVAVAVGQRSATQRICGGVGLNSDRNRGGPRPAPDQVTTGLIQWLWSLSRLWVAAWIRHSERAAALASRWNRRKPRLNLFWANTGSTVAVRCL